MDTDRMVDVPAGDPAWRHATAADADGLELHYVRWGEGIPRVLLLHGWPGFWYDWRRVLPRLAPAVSVVALDFRGFGASAKPNWPRNPPTPAQRRPATSSPCSISWTLGASSWPATTSARA
jgi:pimeloyl-ACP methyl ester carboxylesterase